jgi:hypothetical protein
MLEQRPFNQCALTSESSALPSVARLANSSAVCSRLIRSVGLQEIMPRFEVKIVRMTDEAFPGFVECRFSDASGKEHTILEKAPVVSSEVISGRSRFPLRGYVACEVSGQRTDEAGHVLLHVDTARPHGIESSSGQTKFELPAEQVLL